MPRKVLAEFARDAQLPVIKDNCPACFGMPTQREAMKQLLAQQEADYPNTFKSLQTAMHSLLMPK